MEPNGQIVRCQNSSSKTMIIKTEKRVIKRSIFTFKLSTLVNIIAVIKSRTKKIRTILFYRTFGVLTLLMLNLAYRVFIGLNIVCI